MIPGKPVYKIVRFYSPDLDRKSHVIKRDLTLEEAQKHCSDPKTRKEGEWFDGYQQEE